MLKFTTPGKLVTGYASVESAKFFTALAALMRSTAPEWRRRGGHQ